MHKPTAGMQLATNEALIGSSRGRTSRNHRRLSANQRAKHLPCHLCGQPIDYTLPWDDQMAYQPDHYYPVSTHPHLAEDPGNYRSSHARCNKARGDTPMTAILGLGITANDW